MTTPQGVVESCVHLVYSLINNKVSILHRYSLQLCVCDTNRSLVLAYIFYILHFLAGLFYNIPLTLDGSSMICVPFMNECSPGTLIILAGLECLINHSPLQRHFFALNLEALSFMRINRKV